MGRNTTGPPRGAPWWVTWHMRVLQNTDDKRWQTPATVISLASYTMCNRASSKLARMHLLSGEHRSDWGVLTAGVLVSKQVVSIYICCSYVNLPWSKLQKTGDHHSVLWPGEVRPVGLPPKSGQVYFLRSTFLSVSKCSHEMLNLTFKMPNLVMWFPGKSLNLLSPDVRC